MRLAHPAPFLLPDPLVSVNLVSGAAFLYFSWPIMVTTPPFIVEPDSLQMMRLMDERKPDWGKKLAGILALHASLLSAFEEVQKTLQPLARALMFVWPVYPATQADLEATAELLTNTTSGDAQAVAAPIDCACGELARHIFLEQYLAFDRDLPRLYEYCEGLLQRDRLERALQSAYVMRVRAMSADQGLREVLLTNNTLLPLLDALPIEPSVMPDTATLQDVVAWEYFRQLLSPFLDPLDSRKAELVADMAAHRSDEVTRLRARCARLASETWADGDSENRAEIVARHIRSEVAPDLQELVQLDSRNFADYIASVFSDEKVWLAFAATGAAMAAGHAAAAQGAALAGLATAGAKAVGALRDKGRLLRQSDYALIYRVASGLGVSKSVLNGFGGVQP